MGSIQTHRRCLAINEGYHPKIVWIRGPIYFSRELHQVVATSMRSLYHSCHFKGIFVLLNIMKSYPLFLILNQYYLQTSKPMHGKIITKTIYSPILDALSLKDYFRA